MKKETKNKIFLALKILVSLLFFYILFTKFVNFRNVLAYMKEIKYYILILCLVITFISVLLRAIRWRMISKLYKNISFKDAVIFYLRGIYYGSITPAKAGEFIRGYYYSEKYKISKHDGFASVFFERIFDVIFPVIVVFSYLLLKNILNIYAFLGVVFILTILSWFILLIVMKYFIKYIRKIKFLKKLSVPRIKFDFRLVLNGLLTTSIWICYTATGLIILNAMHINNIPAYYLLFVVCITNIAVLIPITLSGWGIRESTYVFLLSSYVGSETSLLFSVIFTILSTYFLAFIGLILEFTKFRKAP